MCVHVSGEEKEMFYAENRIPVIIKRLEELNTKKTVLTLEEKKEQGELENEYEKLLALLT